MLKAESVRSTISGQSMATPPRERPDVVLWRHRYPPEYWRLNGPVNIYDNLQLLWGDIHSHSGFSPCYWRNQGAGTLDDLYDYARNTAGLDFCAATDHDFAMTDAQWNVTLDAAARCHMPGEFTVLPAYEWTSHRYGHRNVYFAVDRPPLLRCTPDGEPTGPCLGPDAATPADLYAGIVETGLAALVIPHHPAVTQFLVDWSYNDPRFERLAEMTSLWGNFEFNGNEHNGQISDTMPGFYMQDALAREHRLGFVGGGESHDIHPGSPHFDGRRKEWPGAEKAPFNPLGRKPANHIGDDNANTRGLTAVYAPENTRQDVFDALYNRRCYATTGARIALRFSVDGHMMGEEWSVADPAQPRRIELAVNGESVLDRVAVIRNGTVIREHDCIGRREFDLEFVDDSNLDEHALLTEQGPVGTCYYYLRVRQADGHFAWSSPIWITFPFTERRTALRARLEVQPGPNVRPTADTADVVDCKVSITTEELDAQRSALHLRWRNAEGNAVSGTMRIEGATKVFVHPVGFKALKFGGDLFTDDGAGTIRWHCMKAVQAKGLDITVVHGAKPCRVTFPEH